MNKVLLEKWSKCESGCWGNWWHWRPRVHFQFSGSVNLENVISTSKTNRGLGKPRPLNDEVLFQQVERHPKSSTQHLSSEPSACHLHQLGFVNRRPRLIPHKLTEEQAKKRVTICKQLLANVQGLRFWRRIVTEDEKWIFFYNPDNRNQ